MDLERLAAFALMTLVTSIMPGLSMMFIMAQAMGRGWRAGLAAILGLQVGYAVWWVMAGLGLGALATEWPTVFNGLAIGGALYLGWLGIGFMRAGASADDGADLSDMRGAAKASRHAFRDGALVAIGNPKSLIYMVALVPPFVSMARPIWPQIAVLALLAALIDLLVGLAYIMAGRRLARMMASPSGRARLNRWTGAILILIAVGILLDLLL